MCKVNNNQYATITIYLLMVLSLVLLLFPSAFFGIILNKTNMMTSDLPEEFVDLLQICTVVYGGDLSFISTLLSSIPALIGAVQISKYQEANKMVVALTFFMLLLVIGCSVADIICVKMESGGNIDDWLKADENKDNYKLLYSFVEKNFHLSVSNIGIITGINVISTPKRGL